MNTNFIQKISIALIVIFSLVLVPIYTHAEPSLDKDMYDTATIHCKSISDKNLVDACKKGWEQGVNSCERDLTDQTAINTCKDSAKSREKQSDNSQVVCNYNFPHIPGSGSKSEDAFKACLQGYRNGDSACESKRDNKDLYDACIIGANGYSVNDGSTTLNIESSSEPEQSGGQSDKKVANPPTTSGVPGKEDAPEPATCSLTGIVGDIMCDGMNIFGQMADSALYILGAFMKIAPFQTDINNPIYIYWTIFRNVANILFILVFLIVIYSHITGTGLSNYSVKRIIPRLIATVLLVNISFFICSLLVDISNIIGATIHDTVTKIVEQSSYQPPEDMKGINWQTVVKYVIMVPVTGLIGAGSAWAFVTWGGFAALLPVVVSVVIAAASTIIALLLRQTLVIVLTIISPLAFVSIVLPNTKEWLDRWSRIFIPVLMLYPVVSLLFAAGTTASYVIANSVSSSGYPEKIFFIIMAMGVQIVPLLLVPKAMTLGGGLLSSFMGTANNKTTSFKQKARKYSKEKITEGRIKSASKKRSNPFMRALYSGRSSQGHAMLKNKALKDTLEKAETKYALDHGTKGINKSTDDTDSGGSGVPNTNNTQGDNTQTNNINSQTSNTNTPPDTGNNTSDQDRPKKPDSKSVRREYKRVRLHAKEVKAKMKRIELEGWSRDDKLNAAKEGDEAAINTLMESKDIGATFELIKLSGESSFPINAARAIAKNLEHGAFANDPLLSNHQVWDDIRSKKINTNNFHERVVSRAINRANISADTIVNMTDDSINEIYNGLDTQGNLGAADRSVDQQAVRDFLDSASSIESNSKLSNKIGKKYKVLGDINRTGSGSLRSKF